MIIEPRNYFERWSSVGTVEDAIQTVEPNPDCDDVDIAMIEVEASIAKALDQLNHAIQGSLDEQVANETLCALTGAWMVLCRLRPVEEPG